MKQQDPTANIRPDAILDTYGLLCPIPIVKTAERVKILPPEAILEIIATDSGIEADLANWCKSQQHEYLGCRQEGKIYRAFLRVSHSQNR